MIPPLVESVLSSRDPARILAAVTEAFACDAGTVHVVGEGGLVLACSLNIPLSIIEVIRIVPLGKGIAGLAAERREPVSFCNLQSDDTGRARPAARLTGMQGSVAVPMLVQGELRGVLGIAKTTAHTWTDAENATLLEIAARWGEAFTQTGSV